MDHGPKIAHVAALVGEPTRANILVALLEGRAFTASELAFRAGVSLQTTSGHLAKLVDARLLTRAAQGRHRYYRLASALVAQMLESLMVVAEVGPSRHVAHWRGGDALRLARTCYDHMAGRVAVSIADRLIDRGFVTFADGGGEVTSRGLQFFAGRGIILTASSTRRAFCRPCLDWSERRPHLAGAAGARLLAHALEVGWVEQLADTRALNVTEMGRAGLTDTFGIDLPA